MPEQFLRLSQLTAEVDHTLNDHFAGRRFWVMAEVTSHAYRSEKRNHFFELVEKDPASGSLLAKIAGKAWGSGSDAIDTFERITGQRFNSNINVLINVEVQYHALFGLQVNLLQIDVNFTLGALEQQRRATLEKLLVLNPGIVWKTDDKYYTRNSQLALPKVLQYIAVIASRTSAGAEDLHHTLQANGHGYLFFVDQYHAPVQGDQFATEIIRQLIAIFQSGKKYDLVVITRGGGSQSDFIIFDNYDLARAIARFPVPILTGIGHQRNESIADWMAHTSTKTPTQAAEFILAHNRAFEQQLWQHQQAIIIHAQQQFNRQAEKISGLYAKIITTANQTLNTSKDALTRIHQLTVNLSREIIFRRQKTLINTMSILLVKPKTVIGNQQHDLKNIAGNINTFAGQYLKNQHGYLRHFQSIITIMSPVNILQKGFAIIKTKEKIITGTDELSAGDQVEIIMSNATLSATLNRKTDRHATEADL